MSYDPNLQPKGSWAGNCADKPGAGMHVVISTKYLDEGGGEGVYFDVSKRAKAALEALGCTVYNPNTDNEMGENGWLLRFLKGLDSVEPTKGFVYQLQQGQARMKSDMQQAEENMGKFWKGSVPKIGAYIPDNGEYDDPSLRADAWAAVQCARRQWAQGVRPEVEPTEGFLLALFRPPLFGLLWFRAKLTRGVLCTLALLAVAKLLC